MTVHWVCQTAAYIALLHKEKKDLILKNISAPPGCTLVSYSQHIQPVVAEKNDQEQNGRKRASPAEISATSKKQRPAKKPKTGIVEETLTPKKVASPVFPVSENWD